MASRQDRVRLISLTQPCPEAEISAELMHPEGLIAYCARVSSPRQENPSYEKLLAYCADHGHWSIFEMCDMTLEIVTSRAIAQQILRHRSFSFQEFSQRYSESKFGYIKSFPRRQDEKNRQNSIDDLTEGDILWFQTVQTDLYRKSYQAYKQALDRGIAKECARSLLPSSMGTKMYMKGSIRSWIHYCQVRCDPSTQKEHRDIAEEAKAILLEKFPSVRRLFEEEEKPCDT